MTVSDPATAEPAFILKSSAWTLTVLQLETADLGRLAAALDESLGDAPDLFDHEPVAIDLARVSGAEIDFPALLALLRERGMLPVAASAGSAGQRAAALAAGLAEAPAAGRAPRATVAAAAPVAAAPASATPAEPAPPPAAPETQPRTLIIDRPLRSGQQVYARGADLVVLAVVSFGAEVIADGHIHVYAPLRGRAIAGARGDTSARIFATCMEPQLISIAGIYRTTETELPPEVLGKPAQVRLDGERLHVEPL